MQVIDQILNQSSFCSSETINGKMNTLHVRILMNKRKMRKKLAIGTKKRSLTKLVVSLFKCSIIPLDKNFFTDKIVFER